MIDQQLIDSAKYIRKNFVNLSDKLTIYRDDVKNLADFLFRKVEDIKKYNEETIKTMKSKEELVVVTQHLLKEIQSIEEEEKLAKDAELSLQKHLLSICRDRVQHYQEILEHLENSSINHGAEKEVILGELSAVEKDVQFIVSTYGIDDQIPSREVSTSPKRSLSPKKAEASETQSPQDVAVKIEATRNEIMELQKKKIALDADLQQVFKTVVLI